MHANMKLGRIRPTSKQRAEAPRLRDYMTRPLPTAPDTCNNTDGAAIAMWLNDEYGDCTIAALANQRAIDAAKAGMPAPPTTDAAVKATYFKLTGGPDSGLNEGDVLNAALQGLDLGGSDPWMLASWVSVDLSDIETCKSLVNLFRGIYLGIELPTAAQTQEIWETGVGRNFAPGSWGGHAALYSNYYAKETQRIGITTWGGEKLATLDWLDEYGDEGHVLLPAERAMEVGIDWPALCADMNYVSR